MMPIVIKHKNAKLPDLQPGQIRYVVAKNGIFMERRTDMFQTCVKTDSSIPLIEDHSDRCRLFFGKMPKELTQQMINFFKAAYEMHGGESALILLFNPAKKQFKWFCPEQTVSGYRKSDGSMSSFGADVEFKVPLEVPDGWIILGDAHSHGSLSAYASGVDTHDEEFKDGIHIIIGKLDCNYLSWHVDFVMDGSRFRMTPEDFFGNDDFKPNDEPVLNTWMDKIKFKETSYSKKSYYGGPYGNGKVWDEDPNKYDCHVSRSSHDRSGKKYKSYKEFMDDQKTMK